MRISIAGIYNRGDAANERVHLVAQSDVNLAYYVLIDLKRINENSLSVGPIRSGYWFSQLNLKAGEHIVIYTRAGYANAENKEGVRYHFLFRGQNAPVYTQPLDACVLLEINTWVTSGMPVG